MSVVFVDLVASTRLARAMTSDEYFDLMGEILTVLAGEVEALGGHVVQFQGDAVLASFGAPRAHEDDALRALRSAEACLRAVEAHGRRVGLKLHARAGVASGIATAGWVGGEYTVFGTVVNLARRLCSLARTGEVLVSEATRNQTWTRADHEVAVGLSVPDYADERGPYRLLGFKPDAREPGVRGTPFVGMERELALLEARMHEVRSGVYALEVDVVGSLGSGKSRLIAEFARRQFDAWTLTVTPRQALADLARAVVPLDAAADEAVLRDYLREVGAPEAAAPLATVLGLGSCAGPESGPAAVAALLGALSRRDPLILVLERACPLEPEVAAVVEGVLSSARALVLTEATVRGSVDEVVLAPLAFDDAYALLELHAGPLTPPAALRLFERSGGNPFLLEVLGRGVADGVIHLDATASEPVQRVLLARLDRLPAAARETLCAASLSPRGFCRGGLEAVLGRACDDAIAALLHGGWVAPIECPAPGDAEYAVPLPLVREAGYELMTTRARRAAHVRLGVWLRDRAPEWAAEQFRLAGMAAPTPEHARA